MSALVILQRWISNGYSWDEYGSGGGSTTHIGDIDPSMTQKTGGVNDIYDPSKTY